MRHDITSYWSRARRGCHAAFSLVELTVSLCIIVLLAALLFPALRKAREWSQNAQCVNNLRQFGVGVPLYMADNDGYMYPPCPNGGWWWLGDDNVVGAKPFTLYEGAPFAPYVGYAYGAPQLSRSGKGLLYCPAISDKYPGAKNLKNIYNALPNGCLGYALNREVFYSQVRPSNFGGNLSAKLLLADATGVAAMQVTYNYPFGAAAARHTGRINALFMDGHVGALSLEEVSRSGAGEKPFADLISKE